MILGLGLVAVAVAAEVRLEHCELLTGKGSGGGTAEVGAMRLCINRCVVVVV